MNTSADLERLASASLLHSAAAERARSELSALERELENTGDALHPRDFSELSSRTAQARMRSESADARAAESAALLDAERSRVAALERAQQAHRDYDRCQQTVDTIRQQMNSVQAEQTRLAVTHAELTRQFQIGLSSLEAARKQLPRETAA